MRKLQDWFDAYGKSHQNPINKLIHWTIQRLTNHAKKNIGKIIAELL